MRAANTGVQKLFPRYERLALSRRLTRIRRTSHRETLSLLLFLAASISSERPPFGSALVYERLLLAAARSGSLSAAYVLAANYATGEGLPLRPRRAFCWYRIAALGGNAEAQFNLATMYLEGEGTFRCIDQARYWFKRALAGGEFDAKKMLEFIGNSAQKNGV